jgi:DNA-binding transcriptional regulator YhcF (GntR family)
MNTPATSLSRRSLADQVADALAQYILEEGLQEGDSLPSTAELAERFDVSRTVVREALADLAGRGVLTRSQGRESIVATPGSSELTSLLQFRLRRSDMATDDIFESWPFRLVSNPVYAVVSQLLNFGLLWLLVGDLRFAAVIWMTFRVFAVWVNMIQNYWTHDRKFGYRRYDDEHDNAMNIGEWLPVTATFSACLQNNHHHSPGLLRLSHEESEYDFGFVTVRAMKALGLVRATNRGATLPTDVPLKSLGF